MGPTITSDSRSRIPENGPCRWCPGKRPGGRSRLGLWPNSGPTPLPFSRNRLRQADTCGLSAQHDLRKGRGGPDKYEDPSSLATISCVPLPRCTGDSHFRSSIGADLEELSFEPVSEPLRLFLAGKTVNCHEFLGCVTPRTPSLQT